MLPARAAPLAVLLALTAAACSAGAGGTTAAASSSQVPSDAPTTTASPVDGSAPVPEVLDFTAQRLGGGTIEGAQYAGAPLAIWFWAPW